MTKLTAAIISRSGEISKELRQSLDFADELLIIKPETIVTNFAAERNLALKKSKNDWVFFVDDDEIPSAELIKEIRQEIEKGISHGFYIPRIDTCFGKPISHGETGNKKLLRLGDRRFGQFVRPVHEYWKIDGELKTLNSPLWHIKDHFVGEFLDRIAHYGPIDAIELKKEGKPFAYWRMFIYAKVKFFVNYFLKLGFLDGYVGFFLAYLMSVQSLSVRIFQWQNQQN